MFKKFPRDKSVSAERTSTEVRPSPKLSPFLDALIAVSDHVFKADANRSFSNDGSEMQGSSSRSPITPLSECLDLDFSRIGLKTFNEIMIHYTETAAPFSSRAPQSSHISSSTAVRFESSDVEYVYQDGESPRVSFDSLKLTVSSSSPSSLLFFLLFISYSDLFLRFAASFLRYRTVHHHQWKRFRLVYHGVL